MSFRAAHINTADLVVARVLRPARSAEPANDTEPGLPREELLRLALGHFARHGLAAAGAARDSAEAALLAGDRMQHQRWMAICRTLDRRMADTAAWRLHRAARAAQPPANTR